MHCSHRGPLWWVRATRPLGLLCQRRPKSEGLIHRVHLISTGFKREAQRDDDKHNFKGPKWSFTITKQIVLKHWSDKILQITKNGAYRLAWLPWCIRTAPGWVMESCSTAESLLAEHRRREKRQQASDTDLQRLTRVWLQFRSSAEMGLIVNKKFY